MEKELYIARFHEQKIKIVEPNSEVKRKVEKLAKKDMLAAFQELVFNCVVEPNLKDPRFQKNCSGENEANIVGRIFTLGELKYIADEIIKMSSFRVYNRQ